jgi:hypothetical protein
LAQVWAHLLQVYVADQEVDMVVVRAAAEQVGGLAQGGVQLAAEEEGVCQERGRLPQARHPLCQQLQCPEKHGKLFAAL